MDGNRLDELARSLAAGAPRRTVLRGLAGSAAGWLLAHLSVRRGAAQVCRDPGRLCNKDANCCSGLCQPDHRCAPLEPCPPGTENCRGVCKNPATDYQGDVNNCGSCGNRCPAVANETPTCTGGVCGFTCDAGSHRCGNTCLPNTSVNSCGTLCTPCPVPENATATCDGTNCGFACNPGFQESEGSCVPEVGLCDTFCNDVFGESTPAAQQCIAEAQNQAGLCYSCGPASPNGTQTICCPMDGGSVCTTYAGATCCSGQTICVSGTCQLTCGGQGSPCFFDSDCCEPFVCGGGGGTGSGASFCVQP